MYKVEIKNLLGEVTHSAEFSTEIEGTVWVSANEQAFGKPERLVREVDVEMRNEDVSKAIETVVEEHMGEQVTLYRFASTFTVSCNNVAEQRAIEKQKAEALKYLASTDWCVVRFIETQVEVPKEVLAKRADARIVLSPINVVE